MDRKMKEYDELYKELKIKINKDYILFNNKSI